MPATRTGKTHKLVIYADGGDVDVYVRTGEYEDGALGEVFLTISKQGSTLQALVDGWAILLSLCLQHGMALAPLADKFLGTAFPPSGPTSEGECSSVYDAVLRWLVKEYAR